MNNRLELNGLRAIAVTVIIFYHAQITAFDHQLFKGGFIGIDIFFVISGYLITSIILKELVATSSFSLKYFYERRIRRILPILLCVSILTLPLAWIYFLPDKLIYHLKSIITSIAFSSNFYVHALGISLGVPRYFSNPFLHTWSLSVLIQFYFLFPVVLLITFKYLRSYLIHILILGLVISLGLADWGSRNYPGFNFFVLPTRTWELLAGSILAYFEITHGKRSENKTVNAILPSVGLLLIGHSILFFNDGMPQPSIYTISPIIGVCLIIWFSNKNEFVTKILSTKLFVGIGLISYSLYLWHYPIFTLARLTEFTQGSLLNKILIGIIVIILSIFSYYFVERPARNEKNKFKFLFLIITFNYLLIFSLSLFVPNNKYLLFDKNLIDFNEIENTRKEWEKCSINNLINISDYCKIGNYNDKVFLIGDSHLVPLIKNLGKKLNRRNYELINFTGAGTLYRRKLKEDKRVNFLKDIKNSIFIFGGYYQRESKSELDSLLNFYREDFEIFLKNNNKIIFLTPIPEINVEPIGYKFKQVLKGKKKDISIPKTKIMDINKYAMEFISKLNKINVINLNEIFCDEFKCYAITPNKLILKSDYDHPSLKAAEMINDLIVSEIEKIKLQSN